jgi:hypothetical protein
MGMKTFALEGDGGRRLRITVRGYERNVAFNPYDANWLVCSAEVEVGAFRGAVDASFTTNDFSSFLSDVNNLMNGSAMAATFTTMEDALTFRFTIDHAGRARVTGTLRERGPFEAELSFGFESDRSWLASAHSDLQEIVESFPYRTIDAPIPLRGRT